MRDFNWERDSLCDLMRQGFMRPMKARKVRAPLPSVACNGCLNWHPKGKHTIKDRAERKANEARLTGAIAQEGRNNA